MGRTAEAIAMIDVNTETVRRLAELAREIHAESAMPSLADSSSAGDIAWDSTSRDGVGMPPGPAEFNAIVRDLEPDQQQQVVALMWLGRGDFDAEEWDEAVMLAEERWSANTAGYLLSHPMLADELEAGLESLGLAEID